MSSVIVTAMAVCVCGLASWTLLNLAFVLSMVTLAAGTGWLWQIGRSVDFRRRLGSRFVPCLVCVLVGMVSAAAPVLLFGLTVLLASRGAGQ